MTKATLTTWRWVPVGVDVDSAGLIPLKRSRAILRKLASRDRLALDQRISLTRERSQKGELRDLLHDNQGFVDSNRVVRELEQQTVDRPILARRRTCRVEGPGLALRVRSIAPLAILATPQFSPRASLNHVQAAKFPLRRKPCPSTDANCL